jgi:hypothetical protein
VAEELAKVVPQVVGFDAKTQEPNGVDYARLTPLLIEAVKEQQAELARLRRQVAGLDARLGWK